MPFASEFEELTEQTFSGDNVPRGPLQVSDFSRTLLPLLTAEEWADAIGAGGADDALLYTAQTLTTAQQAQARTNLSLIPLASKVIYVSKTTNATDTRTSLSKYDPNKPFATIGAAVAAMAGNETVRVLAGVYTNVGNLAPDLQYICDSVARSSNVTTVTLVAGQTRPAVGDRVYQWFDEVIGAPTDSFDGEFTVATTPTATTYTIANRGANESHNLGASGVAAPLATLHFDGGAILTGTDSIGIFSFGIGALGGYHFLNVTGEGFFIGQNAYCIISGSSDVANFHGVALTGIGSGGGIESNGFRRLNVIMTDRIESLSYDALLACTPETNGSLYVEAPLIWGGSDPNAATASSANAIEITPSDGSKTLIRAKEIRGNANAIEIAPANVVTGVVIIEAQTIVSSTGSAIHTQAANPGSARYVIRCVETFQATHGIHMEDDGSTIDFSGRINTSSNASANPVLKAGGTLILQADALLIAQSGRDSISAATAQTVYGYGFTVNKDVDSDVTVDGEYTINTNAT